MKFGYDSDARFNLQNKNITAGPALQMLIFICQPYRAWMKRKTYTKDEGEMFKAFLEAVDEMKAHFDEMVEK